MFFDLVKMSSMLFTFMLNLTLIANYLQKILHARPKLASLLPEAGMVILVGMVAGALIHWIHGSTLQEDEAGNGVTESLLSFSPTIFFVILLPPIIFNSGYHLHRGLFFRYITPICLFACVGTIICTLVVAGTLYSVSSFLTFQPTFLELMAFGALISATDPVSTLAVFSSKKVDPHLFYLVFGESVINDAVGLVLFEALAHLVEVESNTELNLGQEAAQFFFDFILGFFGSLVLGTLFGLGSGFFLKMVDLRHTPMLELSLYVTIMYAPFVLAEICRLSGIVTVLFTGIAARRYAEPNLSTISSTNADTIFRLTAHLTETLIFLDLGMSVFELVSYESAFNPVFIFFSLVACLIGRAINIYPITFFYNLMVRCSGPKIALEGEDNKNEGLMNDGFELDQNQQQQRPVSDAHIPMKFAHLIWFSGLRGAVSYGLVKLFPNTENQQTFVVTTMFIVLLTTFLLGGTTEIALQFLGIPMGIDENKYLETLRSKRFLSGWLHRFERDRLRELVIRDFKAKDHQEDDLGMEMTEVEHLEIVEQETERKSVYDYGQ